MWPFKKKHAKHTDRFSEISDEIKRHARQIHCLSKQLEVLGEDVFIHDKYDASGWIPTEDFRVKIRRNY